jgi:hypothetical protein
LTLADANGAAPSGRLCGVVRHRGGAGAPWLEESDQGGHPSCEGDLHVVYDPDAHVWVRFAVTAARINDIVEAKAMTVEAGVTYAFDLGFYDFGWWAEIDAKGAKFVTRLKKRTRTTILETRTTSEDSAILADLVVTLPQRMARSRKNPMSKHLREVHVRLDTDKVLRIVSNDLDASAQAIADLYKKRWGIELFFRWVKHRSRFTTSMAPAKTPCVGKSSSPSSSICCCAWRTLRKPRSKAC